jgi:hypothetical protein
VTAAGVNLAAFKMTEPTSQLVANNIRVRLQDRRDEEDLSDADNDNELMMDANERSKIKLAAQKRQAKNTNSSAKKKGPPPPLQY